MSTKKVLSRKRFPLGGLRYESKRASLNVTVGYEAEAVLITYCRIAVKALKKYSDDTSRHLPFQQHLNLAIAQSLKDFYKDLKNY